MEKPELTQAQKDKLKADDKTNKDHQAERKFKKKFMNDKFKARPDARIQHMVRGLAQHAPNHPELELGMVKDHIKKLNDLENHRELNGWAKGKYASDLIDLNVLLSELKAMPDEPAYPELEGET